MSVFLVVPRVRDLRTAMGGGLLLALLLAGCGESTQPEPPPPPPPPPLPVRENISGSYEGAVSGWSWRFVIADSAGSLTGTYAIQTSPTVSFAEAGTLRGTGVQRPAQQLTQDVSITLAGNFIGTFSGTATGRSRMQGMIEYQPADGSDGVSGPFEITFVRSSR